MSDKENLYNTQHTATIFGVVVETIRNWAAEFQDYLSPTANPGRGKRRMYTYDDLKVFSLVAELKKQGMTYPDIHAALHNGQRGPAPALPPEEVQALMIGSQERRLELGVEYLQKSVLELQQQLDVAQEEVLALRDINQEVREENISLSIRLEEKEEQVEKLETALDAARKRIEELLEKSGQSYAKGMLDALERRGDLPSKD